MKSVDALVGAINLDASHRPEPINTQATLVAYVAKEFAFPGRQFMVFSEASGVDFGRNIAATWNGLEPDKPNTRGRAKRVAKAEQVGLRYDSRQHRFTSDDQTALIWDTTWRAGKPTESAYGKYTHFRFTRDTGHIVQLWAVHMPHTRGKAKAWELLLKHVDEVRGGERPKDDHDEIILAGDFNASPRALRAHFASMDMCYAVDEESENTTERYKPDNIVSSGRVKPATVVAGTHFTHKPIHSEVVIEK
jgi:hypothetical protein